MAQVKEKYQIERELRKLEARIEILAGQANQMSMDDLITKSVTVFGAIEALNWVLKFGRSGIIDAIDSGDQATITSPSWDRIKDSLGIIMAAMAYKRQDRQKRIWSPDSPN